MKNSKELVTNRVPRQDGIAGLSVQHESAEKNEQPPPTKWTTSSRSPSFSTVSDQRSRGTMPRFNSTATRSGFIPSFSTKARRVNAAGTSTNSRSSPLIYSFIERSEARSRSRQNCIVRGFYSALRRTNFLVAVRPSKFACTSSDESGSDASSTSILISAAPPASATAWV